MAGHTRQDRLQPRLYQLALALIGQFIQNVADHRLGIDLAQDGRGFTYSYGTAAKGFDPETEFRQIVGHVQQARAITIREFDNLGDQKALRGKRRFRPSDV